MKNQIPEFLQQKLNSNEHLHSHTFPENIKQFIIDYSKFYNWNTQNLKLILVLMRQNITILPKCTYKDCSNPVGITKLGKLTMGCCRNHSSKINTIKKYGTENQFQRESIKKQIKQTHLKKLGVVNPMKSDIIIKRLETKNMYNYGVKNQFQRNTIKDIIKNNNLEKYGFENISKVEEIKLKKKNTNLQKIGVGCPFQLPHIQKLARIGMINKYGVAFASQVPELLMKIQKSSYSYKEYVWKTGEISKVQGYEPIILHELEESGYTFEEVFTSVKDMPIIKYHFEGANRRYFPDIYIPSQNIIIEVKSTYTLEKEWDKNQAKFKATRALGFDFRVEVR